MPCDILKSDDGKSIGFVCSRKRGSMNKCHVCGKPMTKLCDATRKDGKPCDVPMCDEHSNRVGDDTDVCKYHNYPKYIKEAIENRGR